MRSCYLFSGFVVLMMYHEDIFIHNSKTFKKTSSISQKCSFCLLKYVEYEKPGGYMLKGMKLNYKIVTIFKWCEEFQVDVAVL